MIQVQSMGNGQPSLYGNDGQCKHRQMAGKYRQETSNFTSSTWNNKDNTIWMARGEGEKEIFL